MLPEPVFHDARRHIKIYQGDCLTLLAAIPEACVDLIFADPPYFLSNDGITCHAGRMVSVNKGAWDKSRGVAENHLFITNWLAACQRVLKPNGSIWVSGTAHVIHSVGFAMQQLGFKLLNDISWVKPNPPPNLSCRYFTHATETIIWAAKNKKSRHTFHYRDMKQLNGGKQMKSVWTIKPPETAEKRFGKHPTQKPLALLERILLASTNPGDLVLDPFLGSGTTAIAALRLRRSILGMELDASHLHVTIQRLVAQLIVVTMDAQVLAISVDLLRCSVDRSVEHGRQGMQLFAPKQQHHAMPAHITTPGQPNQEAARLVHCERKFFFIGSLDRQVIYSVIADDLEDACRQFRTSPRRDASIFSIIKTETEIYLTR